MGKAKMKLFTFAVFTPDGEEHITVRERSLADAEASLAEHGIDYSVTNVPTSDVFYDIVIPIIFFLSINIIQKTFCSVVIKLDFLGRNNIFSTTYHSFLVYR